MPAYLFSGPTPAPLLVPTPPSPAGVDPSTIQRQLSLLEDVIQAVDSEYLYPDFNGRDWAAIAEKYRALVAQGIRDEDFYRLMSSLIAELGDEHSYFLSPPQAAEDSASVAGKNDFVGIGTLAAASVIDRRHVVIISIFPGSPAEEAGLRPHDTLLDIDGGPIYDDNGAIRTLGEEGSPLTVTVQRPGEPARIVEMVRRRMLGAAPVDSCLVPGTRIGYIFLPTFLDETIADQTRAALEKMTAGGPLEGLVLDNRMNPGGLRSETVETLGLFTSGPQGHFVHREERIPLEIDPVDVGGSQSLPLVVLVGSETWSFAEIFSGVLGLSDRARIVGQTTGGNVEVLSGYNLDGGSQLWLASETFQPLGLENGIWEREGIVPDVLAPSLWELFTEASDPGLAKAIEILSAP